MTGKQWLQIVQAILSSLITAGALFTTLFGESMTLKIIACLGLANIIISSISGVLLGQANLVRDVAAMPGVTRVSINEQASPQLAAVAVDADQPKVGASSPGAQLTLQTIAAKG